MKKMNGLSSAVLIATGISGAITLAVQSNETQAASNTAIMSEVMDMEASMAQSRDLGAYSRQQPVDKAYDQMIKAACCW
ncbi:hypothetical protein [Pseudoalteromonas sp. S16_S37]|uniref:hypothetical protein n=1 Tax=Pseudoalteromonas sp. S16_S37 TaxID=2720228 RepID=UPI00168112C7|nr:hypothetical protein [Pseudoalteromonas sp. S16_S37]MBD1583322.1 hypothetical protein [Pseudoalteromonas sp. S16_S37]